MYSVVGCSACGALWLLSDPGKTATCPRCGRRHQTRKLRRLFESEDRDAAREARATLLADKRGERETYESLESIAEMERQVEDAGIDDREYLEGSGLDAEAVAAAGATEQTDSRTRGEVVRDALRETSGATESDVVDYAVEHGVPADAARDLLDKLVRRGEVSESRGRHRLL
ncbi:MAG: DUF5817 domain-containing protein [Halobacteriota archaeon]